MHEDVVNREIIRKNLISDIQCVQKLIVLILKSCCFWYLYLLLKFVHWVFEHLVYKYDNYNEYPNIDLLCIYSIFLHVINYNDKYNHYLRTIISNSEEYLALD